MSAMGNRANVTRSSGIPLVEDGDDDEVLLRQIASSFKDTIFPSLLKIGFQYNKGYHFDNVSFRGEEDVRMFLLKKGIPVADSLSTEDLAMLTTWVKYAHVKLSDLARANFLSNEGAIRLLEDRFKTEFKRIPLNGRETFVIGDARVGTIQDLCSIIRLETPSCLYRSTCDDAGRRCSRRGASAGGTPLSYEDKVDLQVWAARASLDLPTFDAHFAPLASKAASTMNDSHQEASRLDPVALRGGGKTLLRGQDQAEAPPNSGLNKKKRATTTTSAPEEAKRNKSETASFAGDEDTPAIELLSTEALRLEFQRLEHEEKEYQIRENEKRQRFIAKIVALQAQRAKRIPPKASATNRKTRPDKWELPLAELLKISTKELEDLARELDTEEAERKLLITRITELQERRKSWNV